MKHLSKGILFLSKRLDNWILFYFLLLILIQLFLALREIELGGTVRVIFTAFVFFPTFIRPSWFPFTLILFVGTSINSFICLIPSSLIFSLVFAIVVGLLHFRKLGYTPLLGIAIYYLFICLVNSDLESGFIFMVVITLISGAFVRNEDDMTIVLLSFLLLSLYLSTIFIIMRDQFVVRFDGTDIERGGWTNPNGFGGTISCGVVLAAGYLMNYFKIKKNVVLKLLSFITIVVTLIALALNASRGALFSAIIGIALFILCSNIKLRYKLTIPIILIGLFLILESIGYFELLEYRMDEEGSGGTLSYRTIIWQKKISAFMNLDFFSQFVGIGLTNVKNFGMVYSTHNDFVSALIGFGFLGLILFLVFLFYPLIRADQFSKTPTYISLLFILMECIVLEPFFRGMLTYFFMYLFICKNISMPKVVFQKLVSFI